MSGDPQECRRQAAECFQFAQAASSPKSRDDFTKLANVWLNWLTSLRPIAHCSIDGVGCRTRMPCLARVPRAAWLSVAPISNAAI
jgi:hypothetical protein